MEVCPVAWGIFWRSRMLVWGLKVAVLGGSELLGMSFVDRDRDESILYAAAFVCMAVLFVPASLKSIIARPNSRIAVENRGELIAAESVGYVDVLSPAALLCGVWGILSEPLFYILFGEHSPKALSLNFPLMAGVEVWSWVIAFQIVVSSNVRLFGRRLRFLRE